MKIEKSIDRREVLTNLYYKSEDFYISKSPFSRYEEDSIVYKGPKRVIDKEIVFLMAKCGTEVDKSKSEEGRYINDIDYNILEAVRELNYCTSRMVTVFLNLQGVRVNQSFVARRLKFMSKYSIVDHYVFKSKESTSLVPTYCLAKTGKLLLISKGIPCNWKITDTNKELPQIKEILARNQVMLTYGTKVLNMEYGMINPKINIGNGSSFSPNLQITIDTEDGKEHIFFEVFRTFEGWQEKAHRKLVNYKNFYEYFQPNENFSSPPQLIIVGEDDEHLFHIFADVIVANSLKLSNMSYVYTTDLMILNKEINKSIVNFKLNNDSAEIKVLNYTSFKILKY